MENWSLTWSRLIEITPLTSLLLPSFPGVYRLSYKNNDGKIYVFYVGQADNLQLRINQHLSVNEENVCIKRMLSNNTCYLRYARVNDSRVRSGAELALYRHYSHSCNLIEPSGSNMIINFE